MHDNVKKSIMILDEIDLDAILGEIDIEKENDLIDSRCTQGKLQLCPCEDPICVDMPNYNPPRRYLRAN